MSERAVDIFKKLIRVSHPEKQAQIIRDAWESNNEEFFMGLELALNPRYQFNLTKVPEIQDEDDGSGTLSFKEFYGLASLLHDKKLEGNDAKKAVNQAAQEANVTEWNLWYRKILLKTLTKHLPVEVIKQTLLELTTK